MSSSPVISDSSSTVTIDSGSGIGPISKLSSVTMSNQHCVSDTHSDSSYSLSNHSVSLSPSTDVNSESDIVINNGHNSHIENNFNCNTNNYSSSTVSLITSSQMPPSPGPSDQIHCDSLTSVPILSPDMCYRFQNSVLVSRVPKNITRDTLAQIFQDYCGVVYNCHFVPNSERTVAVIEFRGEESIIRAVYSFNEKPFYNSTLSVQSIADLRFQLHNNNSAEFEASATAAAANLNGNCTDNVNHTKIISHPDPASTTCHAQSAVY